MRKFTAGLAIATALTAVIAGTAGTASAAPARAQAPAPAPTPAAAAAHHGMSLHSWTLLNERGPGPNPASRLTARVDARTTADGRTRGHAVVEHVFFGEGTVHAEFDVDCLTTDGGAITVTGPISSVITTPVGGPADPSPSGWHPETGLTFYPADASGEQRVGWAGADRLHPEAPARATKCGPTPASLWVVEGGAVLRR
ncbi:hypothetical protein [Kitasatospora sp. NPDC097643]|uniref:hypothetical protein n=1 Tax=Kitasatospora sp. NPDC097643 TaxID=3157230 RepID=UPI0033300CF2